MGQNQWRGLQSPSVPTTVRSLPIWFIWCSLLGFPLQAVGHCRKQHLWPSSSCHQLNGIYASNLEMHTFLPRHNSSLKPSNWTYWTAVDPSLTTHSSFHSPSAFIDHVLCAEDAKTGYFCKITSLLLNMPHPVLMYGECKEKLLRKFRIQSKWYPRLERESSAKWDAGPRQCKKGQGKSGNDWDPHPPSMC